MEIIILGSNPLASMLISRLTADGHLVTVVSEDKVALSQIEEQNEVRAICARPSYPESLREAGAQTARSIIAVTQNDEQNMIACQVAHSIFKVPTKIARISSNHYVVRRELFSDHDLPIDVFVNPEKIIARSIKQLLLFPGAKKAYDMCNGQLKAIHFMLDESEPQNKESSKNYKLLKSDHLPDNEVLALFPSLHAQDNLNIINPNKTQTEKVIIAGANPLTSQLCYLLSDLINLTIIDPVHENCLHYASLHPNVTFIHDEFADQKILARENIQACDWFLALTDDDEDNLIAAMQAKKIGCRCALALISRHDYLNLIEQDQIDILLSPQSLVIQSIYSRLLDRKNVRTYDLSPHGNLICVRMITGENPSPNLKPIYIYRNHRLLEFDSEQSIYAGDYIIFFSSHEIPPSSWKNTLIASALPSSFPGA